MASLPPHELLQRLVADGEIAPQAAVQWMIHAYRYSRLLHAMAALDIAGHLRGGPLSTAELAERTGVAADPLGRLLRGLAWCGAVVVCGAGQWQSSPLGAYLDGPARDDALHAGDLLYPAWGALTRGLREDRLPFDVAFGGSFFDYLEDDPAAGERFDRVMNRVATATAQALAAEGELGPVRLLVDVGGGNGETLARLLALAPGARGVVFDLARVEPVARANLQHHGCQGRCTFEAGDFFEAVTPGGDLYILQRVLHDWGDDDCVRILTRVAAALAPGGRVWVVEEVLAPHRPAAEDHAVAIDLAMLVVAGGRERLAEEYEILAERAGLRASGRRALTNGLWVMELRA